MPRLTKKKAIIYVRKDRRTDPTVRKASLLTRGGGYLSMHRLNSIKAENLNRDAIILSMITREGGGN